MGFQNDIVVIALLLCVYGVFFLGGGIVLICSSWTKIQTEDFEFWYVLIGYWSELVNSCNLIIQVGYEPNPFTFFNLNGN